MGDRCFVCNFTEGSSSVPALTLDVREDFIHIFLSQIEDILEEHEVMHHGFPYATRITDNPKGTPFGKGLCSTIRQEGMYFSICSPIKKSKTDLIVATWVCMLQAVENIVRTYGDEVASCNEIRQSLLFQNIMKCTNPYTPHMKGFIRLYDGLEIVTLSNKAYKNMRETYTTLSPHSEARDVTCVVEEGTFRMTCRENGTCGEVLSLKEDLHRRLSFSSVGNGFTTPEQTLTVLAGLTTICS